MRRTFFTPRWIITTLLVVAAVGVMVRLGLWQLDRLEERRAFNERVQAQVNAPPLNLNQSLPFDQIYDMEYRRAVVRGTFDSKNEILLRNQIYENQPGYHLFTPLRIEGSELAVLVDRGFIPLDQGSPEHRAKYREPGVVEVQGSFRRPHVPRVFGVADPTLAPGEMRLDAWNSLNLERIQQQIDYPLLPVYILAEPDPTRPGLPVAQAAPPDLSEGSHLGYALQWFAFAAILGFGYPFFVQKQMTR